MSSARNAGESAICWLRAQPSAEIVRVESAKCRRECDWPAARATLCGDRACRREGHIQEQEQAHTGGGSDEDLGQSNNLETALDTMTMTVNMNSEATSGPDGAGITTSTGSNVCVEAVSTCACAWT